MYIRFGFSFSELLQFESTTRLCVFRNLLQNDLVSSWFNSTQSTFRPGFSLGLGSDWTDRPLVFGLDLVLVLCSGFSLKLLLVQNNPSCRRHGLVPIQSNINNLLSKSVSLVWVIYWTWCLYLIPARLLTRTLNKTILLQSWPFFKPFMVQRHLTLLPF